MLLKLVSILCLTLKPPHVSGDLFEACSTKGVRISWCFGVKDNATQTEAGTGCFFSKDCDLLLFAELQAKDEIKWTVSGHDKQAFAVVFSLTHSLFHVKDRKASTNVVFPFCGQMLTTEESVVYFVPKDGELSGSSKADGNDTYRPIKDKPSYETIGGKKYMFCEYLAKTRIYYQEKEDETRHYDVDLTSEKVHPNLVHVTLQNILFGTPSKHVGWTPNKTPILVFDTKATKPSATPAPRPPPTPPTLPPIPSAGTKRPSASPSTEKDQNSGGSSLLWTLIFVFLLILLVIVSIGVFSLHQKAKEKKEEKEREKKSASLSCLKAETETPRVLVTSEPQGKDNKQETQLNLETDSRSDEGMEKKREVPGYTQKLDKGMDNLPVQEMDEPNETVSQKFA